MKKIFRYLPCLAVFWFAACGIEDYYYLDPISVGSIQMYSNDQATIRLPMSPGDVTSGGLFYYFTHFAIYYRIYVSDIPVSGQITVSSDYLSRLNPTLSFDYFAIEPYLSSATMVNASVGTLFRNRNYQPLALQGEDIDRFLGKDAVGSTLTIDFLPGTRPSLTLSLPGNPSIDLSRSNGDGTFNPQPNRDFVNSFGLYNPANINSTINADVADKSNMSMPERCTYVSMYIVVTGIDNNYSPIYSSPTFIGIFRLPDPA